jgi:hypothetical protein
VPFIFLLLRKQLWARAANVMVGAAMGTVTAIATVMIANVMAVDVIVIADKSLFNN